MRRRFVFGSIVGPGAALGLCSLLLLPVLTSAQALRVITGRVIDAESGVPLENVNVFLSSTTIGSGTGPDGTYRLANIPSGVLLLVASRVGYAVASEALRSVQGESLRVDFRLRPLVILAEGVEVVAPRDEKWQEQLSHFQKAFIGQSDNARKCRIENPEVLNFSNSPGTGALSASSDSVLRIENRSLGYRLYAHLIMFRWESDGDYGTYTFYPRFEPLTSRDDAERNFWQENRRKSYEGSLRHFLSALIAGTLQREGFQAYHGKLMSLQAGSTRAFSSEEYTLTPAAQGGVWKLTFDDWLLAVYRAEHRVIRSYMHLVADSALIDRAGNIDNPASVELTGDWARSRVADLLPSH